MKKGMTLLEVLISLTIFAFTALYISKVFNKSLTQKKEIDRDIKQQRLVSNVLDVVKQDLMGIILVSDLSAELNMLHPMIPSDDLNLKIQTRFRRSDSTPFDFEGTTDKLTFMTFSRNPANPREHQVIKVDYFLRNCTPPNQTESSQCLIRGVSSYWEDTEDTSHMKTTILFENISEFQLSYYDSEEKEWKNEWKFFPVKKTIQRNSDLKSIILPSALNLKITRDSKKKFEKNITFSISHPFLRTHQTQYLTPFIHLKKTKESKKSKKYKEHKRDKGYEKYEEHKRDKGYEKYKGFQIHQQGSPSR